MTKRKEDTYYGLVVETYNHFHPEGNLEDVPFYLSLIREIGGPVLELMCGSGRVLLPLLRHGIDADGVDCSGEMLSSCHERAESEGLEVRLFEQYAQELDLPRKYGTALIPYGSFGLLTERDEALETLRRVAAHLEPGGQLLVDIGLPWAYDRGAANGAWQLLREGTLEGGRLAQIDRCSTLDLISQIERSRLRYSVYLGGRLVESHAQELEVRHYGAYEMELLLEKAGFVQVEVFGNFNKERRSVEEGMVTFRARRDTN